MQDEGALNDFWPVLEPRRDRGGSRIGKVTAGAWSPRLERNIGYAWVPTTHMAIGTPLALEARDGKRDATVATLPFVDPTKEIPKS
jgi:aminomethyltransferase